MNYRISEYRLNDEVIRIKLEGQIAAVGALHHNGFAFRLPGILRSTVDEDAIRYTINDIPQNTSPLELARNEAIAIVTNDVWDSVALEMPTHTMITQACWWVIPDKVVDDLKFDAVHLAGAAHGAEHTAIGLLP